MKKSKFSESQMVAILKEGEAGLGVAQSCREHGISSATYYAWKSKYAGATVAALRFIEPGEPNQNAYIERFNRTYRNEVLDAYLFRSIEQAQHITEAWLLDYNERRPHDAVGGLPPRQFLPRITTAPDSSAGL